MHLNTGQVSREIQFNLPAINHRSRIALSNGLECPVLIFPGLGEWEHSLDRRPSLNFLFELPRYVHPLILMLEKSQYEFLL
jgi:hypothetical protein